MRGSLVLLLFSSACGLTVRGTGPADGGALVETDAGTIATADASADATDVDSAPPCEVPIEEPFATTDIDPAKWIVTRNIANGAHPKPEFGTRQLVSLLNPVAQDLRGAFYWSKTLPFAALDIDVDFEISCPGTCGDGFAIVFVDAATKAQLENAGVGESFGIPQALDGAGVAVDLWQDSTLNDQAVPNIAVLEIDKTKTPGQYDWTRNATPANATLRNTAHRLALSVRDKMVKVKLDGSEVIQGAMPRLPAEGTFGITAASGTNTAVIGVGDIHAKFYRCNAP